MKICFENCLLKHNKSLLSNINDDGDNNEEKKIKNSGGNILGGNFPDGNFPGGV